MHLVSTLLAISVGGWIAIGIGVLILLFLFWFYFNKRLDHSQPPEVHHHYGDEPEDET